MLRYGNVSKRMFAGAEGRLWGGTWVCGNKNLRRIFIFIFYWILILHKEERKNIFLIYNKAGGREREIHYLTFLAYIIFKSREREGRYISGKFFAAIYFTFSLNYVLYGIG